MTAAGRALRVLLVDNNLADLELSRRAFAAAASDTLVEVVTDGAEAIALMRHAVDGGQPLPDLVLLDLNLSAVHGVEVLRALRGDKRLDRLPIVVLTTVDSPEERARCMALGADDFLVKPKRFAELVDLARQALKRVAA